MIQKKDLLKDNGVPRSNGKTDDADPAHDVFTTLYRDAVQKQKLRRGRHVDPACVHHNGTTSDGQRSPSREKSPKGRADGRRNGSNASLASSGVTIFSTSKRVNLLALPRGPGATVVIPPSPNYGRVISFTEEASRESKARRTPQRAQRSPKATVPTKSPIIGRLATPKITFGRAYPPPLDLLSSGGPQIVISERKATRTFRF